MELINKNGITSSVAGIRVNIGETNDYYLDLLDDGNYLVSHINKKIGLFSNPGRAIHFYLQESNGIEITIHGDQTPHVNEQQINIGDVVKHTEWTFWGKIVSLTYSTNGAIFAQCTGFRETGINPNKLYPIMQLRKLTSADKNIMSSHEIACLQVINMWENLV